MGLFSKILPALEVVGGAVLEFVPGGQLAGAMLITEGLASSGIIGGSVGKFLKSGAGQALMGAVSLGSLAYSMYGSFANQAAGAASDASSAANSVSNVTASGQNVTADLTAGGGQMPTGAAISTANGVDVNSALTPASAAVNGASPQTPLLDATGSQLSAQANTQAVQQAAATGGSTAVAPAGSAAPAGATSANPAAAVQPGAADQYMGPNGVQLDQGAGAPQSYTPSTDLAGAKYNADYGLGDAGGGSGPGSTAGSGGGGWMSRLFPQNSIGPSPGSAAITAAGSMLGGLGQGIEQKQAMEQQAAAQQFATRSYSGQTPGTPQINVPAGYLQRAQALRGMLGQTQGIQPAAPTTPSNPGGGPVPIWQVNSTPRGGMPGG